MALFAAHTVSGAQPRSAVDAALIQKYCAECHNEDQWSGGLSLDHIETGHIGRDAEMWERVVQKVRTGMMPPAGEPRPREATLNAFAARSSASSMARRAAILSRVRPGLRRLTRFEYGNAIRDLLGVQADVTSLLPPDNNSDGFDTNGETLGNSPSLVEAYVNAASQARAPRGG